ncbi:GNAT family N-acetyltransferase [Aurantibacter aestuarii]|uniref:GNAT family N-acetyltransferase n=1 Tax=Aurantibacter aestuarii TaxID=1266046 RepID=A0A2T1N9A7_9FLAO|nr:GNAT family N-acetyltransferase [Aurantibacter aestuarii]PSG88455.1 GNAT family N-acetyltransferase [Aurantibacter aestuarii]
MKNTTIIREITAEDNTQIEKVIRDCFPEFGLPLEGTAYADPETKQMFESYSGANETYFVVVKDEDVLGGAGIKPLAGLEESVCELQKMYFSPKVRGLGFGKLLFQKCLDEAKRLGYKQVYIETIPQLEAAIHVYKSFGFKHLEGPMGNTGHYSCGIWMLKTL